MYNKFLFPIFLTAVVLVSGCTSSTTTTQTSVKEFSITASEWAWDPSTITVKQGDTVKLALTSIDVTHGLSIPAFNVNKQITPGATARVEFVADKKGTFPFACSVFCGSGHGSMTGKLVVE